MRFNRFFIILVAALAMCLGSWVATRANSMLTGRPTAVAVVDLVALFDALKEKMQIEADLKARLDKVMQEEEERKTALKKMQDDLSILAPATPAFEQKQNELEKGAIEMQAWMKFENNKFNRERAVRIEALYRKMLEAIGQVAKQNGCDVALFKERPVNFSNAKPEDLQRLIESRKVLWSADELDLTEQVVQKMNNEYANMAQ